MNWVDITILVFLAIGGVLGLVSGLLWQVARLVIFGVSVYVTIYYHGPMADFLKQQLSGVDPVVLQGLSYFFTFVSCYLVLFILTVLIERTIKAMKLKWMDRLLGALLGLIKAALICMILLLGVAIVPIKGLQPDVEASQLAPPMLLGVKVISLAIPDEHRQKVNVFFEDLQAQARKRIEEAEKAALKEALKKSLKVGDETTAKKK